MSQLVGLVPMTAGLSGLTYPITAEGEPVLAYVSFGAYLVALFAWMFGLISQTATIPRAATQRAETGETPTWIHAFWDAGYLAERMWVIGANLAYAVTGLAVLQSDLVGEWAGWVALGLGILIPAAVLATRYSFPEMSLVVPFILGIVTIVESLSLHIQPADGGGGNDPAGSSRRGCPSAPATQARYLGSRLVGGPTPR